MSEKEITFSIIIPTYNRAHMIHRAIESVLGQTYDNWELIIIDDGSTDGTEAIVKGYEDDRIRYFWQENQERSVARNRGIDEARGEWICFLDSDDRMAEDALGAYSKHLEKKAKVFRGLMIIEDEQKSILAKTPVYKKGIEQKAFILETFGSVLHFLFHRSIFEDFRFRLAFNWEDKDFLIRVLDKYEFYNVPYVVVIALQHSDRSILKYYRQESDVSELSIHMRKTLSTFTDWNNRKIDSYINNRIGILIQHMILDGLSFREIYGYLVRYKSLNLSTFLIAVYYKVKNVIK